MKRPAIEPEHIRMGFTYLRASPRRITMCSPRLVAIRAQTFQATVLAVMRFLVAMAVCLPDGTENGEELACYYDRCDALWLDGRDDPVAEQFEVSIVTGASAGQ